VLAPLHPPRERAALVDDAAPLLLLASPALAAAAAASSLGRPVLRVEAEEVHAPAAADGERFAPSPDDLALLVHTSGTTTRPKGVLLRHHHVDAQCAALGDVWRMGPGDTLVHALPLHHVHGLVISLLTALRAGGRVDLLPAFDASAVLEACEDATVFMGVPTMYARLLDALDAQGATARERSRAALSRLRLCTSGSAGLPVSLGERWRDHVGSYPVERFGMTELGVALSNPVEGERVPGSVGRPLPGVRIRVIDETGAEAREGELLVAGPTVFEGYYERPAETAAAFLERDGERWFRTGDTVHLADDGSVRILGRTSVDILKSAGYKLSAPEIEEAIRRHPAVRDAAVVGLPDDTYGQVVAAAVVLRAGGATTPGALVDFLRDELAHYKLPRLVRIVDDLPRTALGKVRKPELARSLAETRET
jgi:malonyl-CoA/methylmalonyl-CoA synthetase